MLNRPHVSEFKILAQRKHGESHKEVKVEIDWSNITIAELKVLAKNAIVHSIHARIRGSTEPVPELVAVKAFDEVHGDPTLLRKFEPQQLNLKKKPKAVEDDELTKLLARLSPEELATLMK